MNDVKKCYDTKNVTMLYGQISTLNTLGCVSVNSSVSSDSHDKKQGADCRIAYIKQHLCTDPKSDILLQ